MLIDLHVHTSAYSACSRIQPRAAVDRAAAAGLTGLAFTEHDRLWPADGFLELEAYAAARELLLVNGAEYRCRADGRFAGDWLVFGVGELPSAGLSPSGLIDAIHGAGGIVVAAHPYRAGLAIPEEAWGLPFDAVEAANGNQSPAENRASLVRARERALPSVGGSDAHVPEAVGRHFTELPLPISSAAGLVAAIRAGRCAPRDRAVAAGRGPR